MCGETHRRPRTKWEGVSRKGGEGRLAERKDYIWSLPYPGRKRIRPRAASAGGWGRKDVEDSEASTDRGWEVLRCACVMEKERGGEIRTTPLCVRMDNGDVYVEFAQRTDVRWPQMPQRERKDDVRRSSNRSWNKLNAKMML